MKSLLRSPSLWVVLLVGVLVALAAIDSQAQAQAEPPTRRRTLVFGLDGVDAAVTERLLAEKKLPNLARIAERGDYARLATANPAQSPVSWASLTTGLNPGGTGIYDFLRRTFPNPETVLIEIGLAAKGSEPILPGWQRPALVAGSAVVGATFGLSLCLVLAMVLGPKWRRGGRLQAAALLPAAVLALGAFGFQRMIPAEQTTVTNLRGGEQFWNALDRHGVRCIALDAPLAFPAEPMANGACMCGLGVPDLGGTWGKFSVWTTDLRDPSNTETGGVCYFVPPDEDEFDLVVSGPPDPIPDDDELAAAREEAEREAYTRQVSLEWSAAERRESETREELLRNAGKLQVKLKVRINRGTNVVVTTPSGQSVTLTEGQLSAPLQIRFERNALIQLDAQVRLLLASAGTPPGGPLRDPFRIFVPPVEFDPRRPIAMAPPIAAPVEFQTEMARSAGAFGTLGWREMTNAVKDDVLADHHFLTHMYTGLKEHEAKFQDRLARDDWDCFFVVFTEPDRVQHALWRHTDPQSPRYEPERSPALAGEIDKIYIEMDNILGRALETLGDDVDVLVVSDHGFAPFRRGVNLNNFLMKYGFRNDAGKGRKDGLKLQNLIDRSGFFTETDWTSTKAYSIGLGNIYLNRVGREPMGIVTPAEAPDVIDAIVAKLEALTDTNGQKVVRKAYRGADIYTGARIADAPDIVVGFERGYRVSWQSCLGALDDDVITDNLFRWSGDHCSVDPSLVPGVLFSTQPLREGAEPQVMDVAAQILDLYGVDITKLDGRPFLR